MLLCTAETAATYRHETVRQPRPATRRVGCPRSPPRNSVIASLDRDDFPFKLSDLVGQRRPGPTTPRRSGDLAVGGAEWVGVTGITQPQAPDSPIAAMNPGTTNCAGLPSCPRAPDESSPEALVGPSTRQSPCPTPGRSAITAGHSREQCLGSSKPPDPSPVLAACLSSGRAATRHSPGPHKWGSRFQNPIDPDRRSILRATPLQRSAESRRPQPISTSPPPGGQISSTNGAQPVAHRFERTYH